MALGCTTVSLEPGKKTLPAEPIYRDYAFKKVKPGEKVKEKGVFLSWEDYQNLLINNELLWGYVEKLEERISPHE